MARDATPYKGTAAKKLVVIGGVAAGTKAAVKAKRDNPELDVTVLEAGEQISYAGCGLPYYIGDVIKKESHLVVRKAEDFMKRDRVRILTRRTVTRIEPSQRKVTAVCAETGKIEQYPYDILVIATGAKPVKPPFP